MSEWQPIETALDLSGEVLGWSADHGHHVIDLDNGFERDGAHEFFNGDVYVPITHWMPLPQPPEEPQ